MALRKQKQAAFWFNSCPDGHGAMFWMADSGKYFCSHQGHDSVPAHGEEPARPATKKWWSKLELEAQKEDKHA